MQFAYRNAAEAEALDVRLRINSDNHQGETAHCPMCKAEVQSRFVNGIWQWVHVSRCKLNKQKRHKENK